MFDDAFRCILIVIWKYILFPIFNYIGLPFRYMAFFLIGRKKPLTFLNRPKKEEPEETYFNQRASNAAVGVFVVVVILIVVLA